MRRITCLESREFISLFAFMGKLDSEYSFAWTAIAQCLQRVALSESPRRSSHQPQEQQQDDRSNGGIHDLRYPANTNMNA
jgi:hypothetical protein